MNPKTMLALARGATLASSEPPLCALCGAGTFAPAGPVAPVLGGNFTQHALLQAPSADWICEGCELLLSGRPGDEPPPLRTRSVLVVDGVERILRNADIWSVLVEPPALPFVLSWATSGKQHHWLHAGVSTARRMTIGSDAGPIEYVPARDRPLLDAVHALLGSPNGTAPVLSRAAILSGAYHPSAEAKFGSAALRALDAIVAPYRPSLLLELVCATAPVSELKHAPEEALPMIDPTTQQAASLLSSIASSSRARSEDGKSFWSGFFRHRIERFKHQPLATCVSRLLDECRCSPTADPLGDVLSMLARWSPDETAAIERELRTRTDLLIALAYDSIRAGKAQKV